MRFNFVIASVLGPLLVGCSKGGFSAGVAPQASTLTYPLSVKNSTIDPGKVSDAAGSELLQNVSEGLVFIDKDFKIVPWLAESWDVKDGGRTYVFHIRKGVKFTNGRELVASDFKWNWERVLAPSFGFPDASLYFSAIEGADEYAAGKAKSLSGVEVLNDHTLQVRLKGPHWSFLYWMTGVQTGVLAKEAVGEKEAKNPDEIVGTGPYRLTRFTPDQEVVFAVNERYWHGRPKVDRIVRPIITDAAARLAMFQTGKLDYIELGQPEASGISKNVRLKDCLHAFKQNCASYVVLGQNAYVPFRDVHVRRAFAMAVNRPHLINDLLTGQREAKGFVPPDVPSYHVVDPGLGYNPAGARRELAAAGYPDGRGLPAVELAFAAVDPQARLIAESIVGDLKDSLGVKASARGLEWGTLRDRSDKGQLPMAYFHWQGMTPEDYLSQQFTSRGIYNKQSFHDAEIDALCEKADVEQDPSNRIALYERADRRAVELAARIPLLYNVRSYLLAPRVKSFPLNASGPMPMFDAEVNR